MGEGVLSPNPEKLYHGVCYYPELWPEADLERDVAEMLRIGINLVRMGEFSWAQIEPTEGEVSLGYFQRVLDRLHAAGIVVVWCTPTPTPPVWLTHGHPDRCFVDGEGRVMSHGARQHVSYAHPVVAAACRRIVGQVAEALGDHPAIVAWQIDNEFGCHVAEDFNPHAVAGWPVWLEERYAGDIERLNTAWGTAVWSEHYQRFDQVPVPVRTPFLHNASLETAWRLYSRERLTRFLTAQMETLRRFTNKPITHNFGLGFATDLEGMCRPLDFASVDDYPSQEDWSRWVLDQDLFRGAKPGRAHWLMETSVAHNGWVGAHETVHPRGFLEAEAVAAFALGAQTLCYWLWRQQRAGCELAHSAVMSAWFKPGIGHAEVQAVSAARECLEPVLADTQPESAEVALTWSDRGRVMLEVEPLGANRQRHEVDYLSLLVAWHRRLCATGVHRDVRFEGAALTGLKLLFTPAMACVDDAFMTRVEAWVRAGGTWVVGPLTGTRTPEHTVPTDAGMGTRLETLAGVETVYAWPLTGSATKGRVFDESRVALAGWCHGLRARDELTEVKATLVTDSAGDGLAWWTERPVGRGRVVVLSAEPTGNDAEVWWERFVAHQLAQAGVQPAVPVSTGTIVVPRTSTKGRRLLIAINLDGRGGRIELQHPAVDALTNADLAVGEWEIPRYGWRAWWT